MSNFLTLANFICVCQVCRKPLLDEIIEGRPDNQPAGVCKECFAAGRGRKVSVLDVEN